MEEWLEKYAKIFGDGFPTIPLAWGKTEEEVIEIIKQCIAAGKDVYEMGLVEENSDLQY